VVQSGVSTYLAFYEFYSCFNGNVLQHRCANPNSQILISREHINPIRGISCELATADKLTIIDIEGPLNWPESPEFQLAINVVLGFCRALVINNLQSSVTRFVSFDF